MCRKPLASDSKSHVSHHYHNTAVFGKNEISNHGDSQDENDDGLVSIVMVATIILLLILIGYLIYKVKMKRSNTDENEGWV